LVNCSAAKLLALVDLRVVLVWFLMVKYFGFYPLRRGWVLSPFASGFMVSLGPQAPLSFFRSFHFGSASGGSGLGFFNLAALSLFFCVPALSRAFVGPSLNLRLHVFQKKRAQLALSLLAPLVGGFNFAPIFSISGSLVAACVALGRAYRATPLAQLLACQWVRRYLVSLVLCNLDLRVDGGVGLFSAF
jgi:hypothetical protein